jgi:hypothetical protein
VKYKVGDILIFIGFYSGEFKVVDIYSKLGTKYYEIISVNKFGYQRSYHKDYIEKFFMKRSEIRNQKIEEIVNI